VSSLSPFISPSPPLLRTRVDAWAPPEKKDEDDEEEDEDAESLSLSLPPFNFQNLQENVSFDA